MHAPQLASNKGRFFSGWHCVAPRADPVGSLGMARHILSPAQQETYPSIKKTNRVSRPAPVSSPRLRVGQRRHAVPATAPPPCPPVARHGGTRPPLPATTRHRPQQRGAAAGGRPALGALARGRRRQAPCPAVPHGPTPLTNFLCAPVAGASSGNQRSFPPAEAN